MKMFLINKQFETRFLLHFLSFKNGFKKNILILINIQKILIKFHLFFDNSLLPSKRMPLSIFFFKLLAPVIYAEICNEGFVPVSNSRLGPTPCSPLLSKPAPKQTPSIPNSAVIHGFVRHNIDM
jgi:hypothetical protein